MRIGHEREPGEFNKLQESEMYISNTTRGQTVFSERKAADPTGKQEGNPTKGLTYEELGRNNGKKKDGRRRTGGLLEGRAAERIQMKRR